MKILSSLWEAQELEQMGITMHVLPKESMNSSIYQNNFKLEVSTRSKRIKHMEICWNTFFLQFHIEMEMREEP